MLDLLPLGSRIRVGLAHRHQQDPGQLRREMLDQQQVLARPTLNPDARDDLDFNNEISF